MFKFVKSLGKKSPGGRRSSQDKGGKRSQSVCLENDESFTSWVKGRNNEDYKQESDPVYIVKDKELGKLHKAAWYGQLDKVKVLAKRDPSAFDKCHRTPLHLACCRGYAGIVQELLAWNARTSVGDKESKTPLMKAVECGHADVVEVLLSYQVDGEARDLNGDTSLHLAVKHLHIPIINALLKAGTNPNLKNVDGKTPLHYAMMKQDLKVADILLKNKADVNAIDNKQRTSLMLACQLGDENIASFLLKKGASIVVKDNNGWSASDHALVKGHQACVRLLENHLRQQQDEDLLKDSTDSPVGRPVEVEGQNSKVTNNAPQMIIGGSSVRRSSMSPKHLPPQQSTSSPTMYPTENNAEDSGDETVTFSSHCSQGKDAGSDSWADDTDISLGIDDKKGKGSVRVSLAKFIPKTSDNEDNEDGYAELNFKKDSVSPNNNQENNGLASSAPRKGRVSFKEDNEISEVFTSFDNPDVPEPDPEPIYATINKPKKLTLEQQRAFMDELGFSDNEDITEGSAPICGPNEPMNDADEESSDWDTSPRSQSEQMSTIKLADTNQRESLDLGTNASMVENFHSSEMFPTNNQKASELHQPNTSGHTGKLKAVKKLFRDLDESTDDWDCSVPSNLPSLRKASLIEEHKGDKVHTSEESDWDSTIHSGQPTPRTELTDVHNHFPPLSPINNTTPNDEYFQRTSSLRRMNMAASKIMTLSNESPECIDMYIGQYKSAYEEVVNLGVVDDVAPDKMVKSQILQELDRLLEANSSLIDVNEPGAKNKLLEAARTVTDRINQMIDVCSGDINAEDEIKATDSLESQVKEDILELVGFPSQATLGELRQSYLYKPDSHGNVVDDGDDDSITSGNDCQRMPSISSSPEFSNQRSQNQNISKVCDRSSLMITGGIRTSHIDGRVENLNSSTIEQPEESLNMRSCLPTANEIIRKEVKGEKKPKAIISSQKLEENIQNVTSTPKPLTEDMPLSNQVVADFTMSGNEHAKNSIIAPTQKSLFQPGPEMFAEGLTGFNYFDCSDILKDDDLMSLTSTENEGSLTGVQYNKDVLMNLNLNDSSSIGKIQEHLRESRQKLEKERNQRTLIENQYRILQQENNKLYKKIEVLIQEKTVLEEAKISLEAKIRNLQYKLSEETDKSKETEILLKQSKKQLEKIDQQCKKDFEDKQQTDHSLYQTELELKRVKHSLEALEAENQELNNQFKNLMQGGIIKHQDYLQQLKQQFQNQHPDKIKGLTDEALQKEMTYLKEENNILKEQISKLKLEKNNVNLSESREFLLKIDELQFEKRQVESALQECKHKHELEQHTLMLEKRQLNDSVAKIQMERDKLQENYIQVQVQYESAKQEKNAQKELQINTEESFQKKIQEIERENIIWKQDLEKEKETNEELKKCISSLKSKITELENELRETESNLKYQMIELEDAQHNKKRSEQENNVQILSLQEAKKSLEKDVHNLEVKKSGLEIELHHEKSKVDMLQKDLDLLRQNSLGNQGFFVEELQVDNAKLVAEVEHEKQKCSLLEQQLLEEQNARYSLDANLKEVHMQLEKNAGCNENVEPILNKTCVGKDMLQQTNQIDEDYQQLREALDQQRKMENKFESQLEKNKLLQTEILSLKSTIKKKKENWSMQWDREKKRLKALVEKEKQKANDAIEKQKAVKVLFEAEIQKNHILQSEILNTQSKINKAQMSDKLSSSLPTKSVYVPEEKYQPEATFLKRQELDSYLKTELTQKLEEVNNYLLQQHQEYEVKMAEKENQLTLEKNKLQEEVLKMKLNYEKVLSHKEQQAKEAMHFRDLYHHELFLKEIKGNLQPSTNHMLYIPTSIASTDSNMANNLWEKPAAPMPSSNFNNSFLHSSSAANFNPLNLSPKSQGVSTGIASNTEYGEMFARWKNEMHRSIKRHLEAPPYDNPESTLLSTLDATYPSQVQSNPPKQPLTVSNVSSSLTKSKAEFLSLLNRKYCL